VVAIINRGAMIVVSAELEEILTELGLFEPGDSIPATLIEQAE